MKPPWTKLALTLIALQHIAGAGSLAVDFQVAERSVVLHAPVIVEVLFRNTGSTPLDVDLGLGQLDGFEVSVRGPDGKETRAPRVYSDGASRPALHLDGGAAVRRPVLLSLWYKMEEPGEYNWTVSLPAVGARHTFELTVLPANDQMLRAACERLMKTLATNPEWEEQYAAVVALGHVGSDVAVPLLSQIMQGHSPFQVQAAEGLGGIGTVAAAEALIGGLREGAGAWSVTKEVARRDLARLAKESGDSNVRTLASSAL